MSMLMKKKYLKRSIGVSPGPADDSVTCKRSRMDDAERSSPCVKSETPTSKAEKKVQFLDRDGVISLPWCKRIDAETLQRYRADIWYSRDDYRTFWKDRIDTVRVWRSIKGETGVTGRETHFCVRGLEAYLDKPTQAEISRQHELYMAAALVKNYDDSEQLRRNLQNLSSLAVLQAQELATQDANSHSETEMERRPTPELTSSSTKSRCLSPPESPSSIAVDLFQTERQTAEENVKDMNQRLIQHMHEQQVGLQIDSSAPVRRGKMKRRNSVLDDKAERRQSMMTLQQKQQETIVQRRNSMQMYLQEQECKERKRRLNEEERLFQIQLLQHQQQQKLFQQQQQQQQQHHQQFQHHDDSSRPRQQTHRAAHGQQEHSNSISDDLDRHMDFCNQLLCRQDCSASLYQYDNDSFPIAQRRDSLYHTRVGRRESMAIHGDYGDTSFTSSTHERKQQLSTSFQMRQQSAKYDDAVTQYSKLRRDSLVGRFT